jgi:cell division protein FtsX
VKNRTDILQSFYVTNSDAIRIGILVLFIGAAIGTVGSAIGLRRFLEA